jgi:hypothetical protein
MQPGDMVKWWIPDKLGDKKFGLAVRLDERSGAPGAWVIWNDGKQPMWSPLEMLTVLREEKCVSEHGANSEKG